MRLGEVFEILRKDARKLILIIDEFDRVEDPDIDALFADIIKALSDFSVDTTLILVGVADDVDDLITEHESINRCLSQIHLPRMSIEELIDIVASGIQRVGMEISKDALSQIGSISLGLPHYAHAFGLASGRSAIEHRRLKVETDDVTTAIDTLVHQSQQTILQQFDKATASPRKRNNYFTVLLACALASTNELGYFRAADVRAPYSRIMGRDQNIPTFNRHLHELCGDNRGTVLQRFGSARNYRFRFTDPVAASSLTDAETAYFPEAAYHRSSAALKAQAVEMYQEGSSLSAVGRVFGYSATAVHGWVKKGVVRY